ncbi:MAG TPA: GDP-mannose 4,6-dehydratase [Puia sp.]|nr:GDP-mannose 4,6-dehydratase [Puia sp.]
MTAIIFGAKGQDGYYLTELLTSKGFEVVGISRENKIDISNFFEVKKIIKDYKPAYIFHLAADSTTKHSALLTNHDVITTGSINILESVKICSPSTKIFLSGSGLQFKNEGRPIKETDAFDISSAYSMSRIQSVIAARYYRTLGVKTYVGYFFNHDSPLRTERHISQKIISAVKRISSGSNEKIEIGDMSVKKEWGFAGDIVKGIWTLVEQEKYVEAMIGTGKAYSIQEWLEACFSLVGKNWNEHVLVKNNFVAEYSILVSDPATIFSLGWKPEVSFQELAQMMLNKS